MDGPEGAFPFSNSKTGPEISGGERQLTVIARALAQGAETVVMDEPGSGLDYGNKIRLLEWIMELSKQGFTFIKTSHFPDHALWMADKVLMLKGGELIASGEPLGTVNQENLNKL